MLIFFHGDSLAHTIRPLPIGRALQQRGYPVEFAGAGRHRARIAAEGFRVHPVESMPQSYIDERVARCEYDYYDADWTERCVAAERGLLRRLGPDLVIGDFRPTLLLSSALEGVDAACIHAAYNLPAYPFRIRLPECFPPPGRAIAEAQRLHAAELQPHLELLLLADVPELHPPGGPVPPGYYYVGPLIEMVPEPASISALADGGWDSSRPLVYLNCGSTGAQPAFLEGLLHRLADLPVRVVVTTAGRWTGASPSPNIRVIDFLPANWILRRGDLFVGIGGIGSICHALAQGVPIVGAPEHIDQEYHLNRVRDLGLGIKLNWDAFLAVEPLVDAIRTALTRLAELRAACTAFAPHVRRWKAGEAAADVVDGYLAQRQAGPQIPAPYVVSEAEFVRHLELSTPAELTAQTLQRMLRCGRRRGMPHQRFGPAAGYDRAESWNWLYDNEPAFFGADYRALEARRQAFFTRRNGFVVAARTEQRYRVTYTFRLHAATMTAERSYWLFVPYPIPGSHQTAPRLLTCSPQELASFLIPAAGFFYGYPVRTGGETGGVLEYSYSCELTVQARTLGLPRPPVALPEGDRVRFTQADEALGQGPLVRRLREDLGLDAGMPALEKARAIYEHLARRKRFKKTMDRCQCPACSVQAVLSDTGGHCITLANAFIGLCRLEGIPAREVTGALAGYPSGPGRYEIAVFNEILFGHTWAEFHAPEHGWVPVEFHGIVIGKQAMTEGNVTDEGLAALIEGNTDPYLEYYVGNLDCHRVVCSNSVKRLPHVLAGAEGNGTLDKLAAPPEVRHECWLVFECI
ncbi:MAG: transglutaminase domain-containing protein [Candidatus Latescibacterota bacterium]